MDDLKKLIVAGGSGFVGREICRLASKLDFEVVILSRSGKGTDNTRGVEWNGSSLGPWAAELEDAHAVINLTGESITLPWTKENQGKIVSSRVQSTRVIGEAINICNNPPLVWVNASAIGIYGNRGSVDLNENSEIGPKGDFLVDTCFVWEEAIKQVHTPKTRKAIVRVGFVLGNDGGAYPMLKKFTNMYLGGHHGSGDQVVSWIHLEDLARLFLFCANNETPLVMNGTAPQPCSNRFLMASLRGVLGKPWSPPVPGFALKIAQLFGAPEASLVLNGQRVIPSNPVSAGFKYHFDNLRDALVDVSKPG